MAQIRFRFECGCIHTQTTRMKSKRGSARRYCPKHPDSPATDKVFTCAHCGKDVFKSLLVGGASPKYHPECQRIAWDERRKERIRKVTESGGWNKRRGGKRHTTEDEIGCIRTWRKDTVWNYLNFCESEHGAKRDWGDIDPVAVKQACREILEGSA